MKYLIMSIVLVASIAQADDASDQAQIIIQNSRQTYQGQFSQPVYAPPAQPVPVPVYVVPSTYNGLGSPPRGY